MTSETPSPTPTDSPSLCARPLLRGPRARLQGSTPKRVGFADSMRQEVRLTERGGRVALLGPPTVCTPDDVEGGRDGNGGSGSGSPEGGGGGGRLAEPRMSLLGRPLSYRATRRDARYRRLQSRVYNFLERPRGARAVLYHMLVFLMVFMCLALSVFSTIDEYEVTAGIILFYMETVVVVWFAIEFVLRLWSSGCRSRYQGSMGRLKFLRRPFCIIDVTTILASLVVLGMGSSGQVFAASALRGLRFFQILRMVRMDRRGGTWKLLGSVVYAHRQELITTLYIGFLGLIFASFLVYLAEKDVKDSKFSNFAQALWWGVITLCTVGYGDMVPETWQGKVIASFCALLGISFFALPAGILGSGFALKVQQQQRQKHMIRRRQPAATLIQSLWRCYAADEHSMSVATWKMHQIPLPSPPTSFKHNASFVSRLPTIRRHKSTSLHSPAPHGGGKGRGPRPFHDMNASAENLVLGGGRHLNPSHSEDSVAETALCKKNSDAGLRSGSSQDLAGACAGAGTGAGGVGAVRHLGGASAVPLALLGLLQPDTSGSVFFFPENEDDEPRCVALTNQHKSAIRFIRKLKYFLARKRFREALKPYDVKDVIEQYSSGHADLLNRTRNLQFRLDQILGKQGSKAMDVYAGKVSLASRIVKVERQVDDIETKLDQLLELYLEDRKRFPVLMEPAPEPCNGGAGGGSGEPPQPPRPRPILVDKQCSEPTSPIALAFNQGQAAAHPQLRRPMHRGYSDLGNRIRKRVTLSGVPQCEAPPRPRPPPPDSTGQHNDNGSADGSDSGSADDGAWATGDGDVLDEGEGEGEDEALDEGEEGGQEEIDHEGDYDSMATEDTALLRVAATTEIIITPISGGSNGRQGPRGRRPGDAPVPLDLHLLRPEPPRPRAAEEV